jgi:PAS domain S-box-containing protein
LANLAAEAQEPIILQLKWYHQFQFAGYYAAEEKGFYKAEGLEVEIREGSPSRPPLESVLAGQAHFGVSDDDVLLARLRGRPTVACAAIFQHSPYIVLARGDSGISKPSDLIGRTVMVANDQGATQLKAMLRHEGIPRERVKLVPHTWKLRDLINGEVDAISAYSTVEPTQMRQQGVPPAIIRVADYGVDFYGDTLFTTETVVQKDRARAAAFVRASLKGWEYAMKHSTEMIDLILKKPGVKERGLRRENLEVEAEEMRALILPDVVDIGHMNLGRWERMEEVFRETGLTRKKQNLKPFLFEAEILPDWRLLWTLGGVLAVAILVGGVVLLWNFQLRRKVEQSTGAVRLSEAKLTALIENTSAAIWSVDREYRYVTFNSHFQRQALELIGRLPTVGMKLEDLLPPEKAAERTQLYERALAGEHFVTEVVFAMKSGPRTLEQSFSPIISGDEVTGVTVFSFDITEQRRLEEQLRQSQKMDAIGQLAGGVAHDFNNLLMVIQGNASLAVMAPLPPEEIRAIFQDILAATERAAALTGQLLAFSRRQPMQPRELEMNAVVAEVARMLERLIGEHIALETHFTSEPTLIHADTAMIEQVLLNLAVNARDAMPQGGRLTLRTNVVSGRDRPGGMPMEARAEVFIRIDVSDTGIGIPADSLPHIFEPFFTTKEVGKGTGLGLATAFGIAQQHGGWLSVASEPGQGSTFSLFLPRHEAARPSTPPPTATPAVKRGTETILVVEDDATVRTVVLHVLNTHGYRIHQAVSGRSALDLWEQCGGEVDLLLTDMVMPGGVSGHDLAQQLLAKKPSLKVIYTSGYSAEVFRGDFVLPERVAFLRKPYRAEELLAAIRQALDTSGIESV